MFVGRCPTLYRDGPSARLQISELYKVLNLAELQFPLCKACHKWRRIPQHDTSQNGDSIHKEIHDLPAIGFSVFAPPYEMLTIVR